MADLTSKLMVVIDVTSAGAVRELDGLQRESKKTGDAFDGIGKKAGLAGSTIKAGLVAGAAALVGTNLVGFLNDSVDAFVAAQDAAAQFARATNATVAEAGKFTTVAAAYGLEMNDLIEINAEFSKKVQEQPDLLRRIGVEVAKNSDGSVNMTKTLVSTIDALGAMEDGLGAAQTAAQLFGEEGSKQLAGFYLAGIKVSDLMDRIDFVDQSDAAMRYKASTQELNLAFQQLQTTVGADLVPVMTGLVDVGARVVGFITSVPSEVYLVAGAAVLLSRVLSTQLVAGAFSAVQTGALVTAASLTSPTLAFGLLGAAAQTAGAKIKTALVSNAPNLAIAGLTVAVAGYMMAARNAEERTAEFAAGLRDLEESGVAAGDALGRTAQSMIETSSYWERFVTNLRNSDTALPGRLVEAFLESWRTSGRTVEAYERALEKARDEAGEYGVVAAGAAMKQEGLNEMLATGEYTVAQLAGAVREAADAQAQKNRVDELSKGLIEVQLDSTIDAVKATRELIDAEWAAADAKQEFIDALKDQGSSLQDVSSAALDAADAAIEQQKQADQLAGVYRDQAFYTNLAVAELERLRDTDGTSPEQQAGIQALIDKIRAAQETAGDGVFVPLSVEEVGDIDARVAELKARIAAALAERNYGLANALQEELYAVDPATLPERIRAAVDAGDMGLASKLTAEYNAWAAGTGLPSATLTVDADTGQAELKVGALTGSKTVPVTVTVDGVDGATQEVEALAVPRESTIVWGTSFEPGGYNAVKSRVDFLSDTHRGLVDIGVLFSPDGYLALKARKDYLAQDRTATITINQVTGSTVSGAGGGDDRRRSIPNLYANVQPTNIVKVSIDGQPLRAWIRSEVAAAQPARAGVA